MASCRYCELALNEPDGDGFVRCRFCKAEFEVRVGQNARVHYAVLSEPAPEMDNRIFAKKQLKECARLVITKPKDALELLTDTWVGLWADAHGTEHRLVDEVDRLRKEVEQLREENAELQRQLREMAECLEPGAVLAPEDEAPAAERTVHRSTRATAPWRGGARIWR